MIPAFPLSMVTFSLAGSTSPGPVNVVARSAGMRYGFRAIVGYVAGATVGFTLLLVLIGFGLNELVARIPQLLVVVQWVGVLFLIYLAVGLALDNGNMSVKDMKGSLLQWLNPKAWLASTAGMGASAADGDWKQVLVFAGLYFLICYVSIGCRAFAGAALRGWMTNPARLRLLNRILALSWWQALCTLSSPALRLECLIRMS